MGCKQKMSGFCNLCLLTFPTHPVEVCILTWQVPLVNRITVRLLDFSNKLTNRALNEGSISLAPNSKSDKKWTCLRCFRDQLARNHVFSHRSHKLQCTGTQFWNISSKSNTKSVRNHVLVHRLHTLQCTACKILTDLFWGAREKGMRSANDLATF